MALERVPADIRANGGVARMVSSRPTLSIRRCAFGLASGGRLASQVHVLTNRDFFFGVERPAHDQGDRRGRDYPRHGEVPHRSLRRGAGACIARCIKNNVLIITALVRR